MHELKIIQNILPLIEKTAKNNQLCAITRVVLKIGELRQLQQEFLQFAFTAVAANTIAQGAELIIEQVPTTVFCAHCQKIFTVEENIYICPKCAGMELDVVTGKEVMLVSVDGERE